MSNEEIQDEIVRLLHSDYAQKGELRPVGDYVAMFPGHEEFVRDSFIRVLVGVAKVPIMPTIQLLSPTSFEATVAEGEAEENGELEDLGDRYEPLGMIAEGGMGIIEAANDSRLERVVALKSMKEMDDPNEWRRFRREGLLTARLAHPNIVPVHDLGFDKDGRPCLAMKLVGGRSLGELIESKGESEADKVDTILRTAMTVCGALSYAHANGVVHLDIKPDNIMIGTYGEAYLMDWGISRPIGSADIIEGTPAYMSPEQATGGAVTPQTDVFALGAMLYRALTKTTPFTGGNSEEVIQAASECRFLPLREVNPKIPMSLARMIEKSMSAKPEDRYVSAAAFRDDIWRYLRGERDLETRRFDKGSLILAFGGEAHGAFHIVEGQCKVFVQGEYGEIELAQLGPGDTFGELALLCESTRTANIRALTPVVLKRISRDVFHGWMEEGSWITPFVQGIADRLTEVTETIVKTKDEGVVNDVHVRLFRILHESTKDGGKPPSFTAAVADIAESLKVAASKIEFIIESSEDFHVDLKSGDIFLSQ